MVNSARNARQSISAKGVPARKTRPRQANSNAINAAPRHAPSRVRTPLTIATTVGIAARAALYLVEAASPDKRPAPATRIGVTPRVAHRTAAPNAHTVTKV